MSASVETMMYSGETPWHGLGHYVGDEPVDSAEAMTMAGLDWSVGLYPIESSIRLPDARRIEVHPRHYAVLRDSDDKILGQVSEQYRPIQNQEAFAFLDSMATQGQDLRYHTAGALRGGRRVWMLAKLKNHQIEPIPGDVTQPYLLLTNRHDGKGSLRCFFTTVRVVCQNTLNWALSEGAHNGVSIRHTGDVHTKLYDARSLLQQAEVAFAHYSHTAVQLASQPIRRGDWSSFLTGLLAPDSVEDESYDPLLTSAGQQISDAFISGPGSDIPGVRGTRWGALQAVTHYTTHLRRSQTGQAGRLEAAWFGTGNQVNQRAVSMLTSPAETWRKPIVTKPEQRVTTAVGTDAFLQRLQQMRFDTNQLAQRSLKTKQNS